MAFLMSEEFFSILDSLIMVLYANDLFLMQNTALSFATLNYNKPVEDESCLSTLEHSVVQHALLTNDIRLSLWQ